MGDFLLSVSGKNEGARLNGLPITVHNRTFLFVTTVGSCWPKAPLWRLLRFLSHRKGKRSLLPGEILTVHGYECERGSCSSSADFAEIKIVESRT